MFHVPHGLTYSDLLTEFVDVKYHSSDRVATVRHIKATFKKITGIGINELVSGYNYQQVIDTLSSTKIPHCTFAKWLRIYEWKTPQQSENAESGNTFDQHVKGSAVQDEGSSEAGFNMVPATIDNYAEKTDNVALNLDASARTPYCLRHGIADYVAKELKRPRKSPLKIIDVFVIGFGETDEAYFKMHYFIEYYGRRLVTNPWHFVEVNSYIHSELLEYFYQPPRKSKTKYLPYAGSS